MQRPGCLKTYPMWAINSIVSVKFCGFIKDGNITIMIDASGMPK